MTVDERYAYLTDAQGRKFQVLNQDGTDWDEEATAAAYLAANPEPGK